MCVCVCIVSQHKDLSWETALRSYKQAASAAQQEKQNNKSTTQTHPGGAHTEAGGVKTEASHRSGWGHVIMEARGPRGRGAALRCVPFKPQWYSARCHQRAVLHQLLQWQWLQSKNIAKVKGQGHTSKDNLKVGTELGGKGAGALGDITAPTSFQDCLEYCS